MTADHSDIVSSLVAIQQQLRKLPRANMGRATVSPTSQGGDPTGGYLKGLAGAALRGNVLGCRLLHWDPELEKFRAEVIHRGQPASFIVYRPLDVRIGSKPHVFFAKVYKTKYKPGQSRSAPAAAERQFGITYSGLQPKREVTPILDAFKRCATEAGEIVASVSDRLVSNLPVETLATKDRFHRWIFTVYDVAWRAPSGSPQAATRYIPIEGFGPFMTTDESVLYDLGHIRSTPWSVVEGRLDVNGWGSFSHFKESYASWGEKLPEYFASRIDDIVQASDWTIDWLLSQLGNR